MTTQQAKQILIAYRPWAVNAADQEMAEALALCRADAELSRWFAEHCQTQVILRAKLRGIKAPEGLQEQIVSECRAKLLPPSNSRRRLVAAMAWVAIVISAGFIWQSNRPPSREDLSFNAYRNRMTKTASRAYGMDVETNSLAVIQAHLVANQAPVNYTIPDELAQTPVVGCGVLRWQNKPVTMVCYQTGKPLPPGMKSDLILFVVNEGDVRRVDLPETQFSKVSEWFTASWQAGDKVYLLAATDAEELRKRL